MRGWQVALLVAGVVVVVAGVVGPAAWIAAGRSDDRGADAPTTTAGEVPATVYQESEDIPSEVTVTEAVTVVASGTTVADEPAPETTTTELSVDAEVVVAGSEQALQALEAALAQRGVRGQAARAAAAEGMVAASTSMATLAEEVSAASDTTGAAAELTAALEEATAATSELAAAVSDADATAEELQSEIDAAEAALAEVRAQVDYLTAAP